LILLRAALSCSIATLAFPQIRAFEVASVKPSYSRTANLDGQKGGDTPAAATFEADHLTFRARNMNLFGLIVEAYGLKYCRPLAESCRRSRAARHGSQRPGSISTPACQRVPGNTTRFS
jgi:hypothetical protein